MTDHYLTITNPTEGEYTEKRSKFLAFAFPVSTKEQIADIVKEWERRYYDARHVCYAYMLGPERLDFRTVDNGEPSGTAGKPILGQINSHCLTDILIIVVRYFGGVKLGTSGLQNAYKIAANEAIQTAQVEERLVKQELRLVFEYPLMNQVMRLVKNFPLDILGQDYEGQNCVIRVSTRLSLIEDLAAKAKEIRGVEVKDSF